MKIELERESKWDSLKSKMVATYWIKVDGHYVEMFTEMVDALDRWEVIKSKYQTPEKRIVETLDVDVPIQPIVEVIQSEEVIND